MSRIVYRVLGREPVLKRFLVQMYHSDSGDWINVARYKKRKSAISCADLLSHIGDDAQVLDTWYK